MNIKLNRRILVVDDNTSIHEDFRKILSRDATPSRLEAEKAFLFDDAISPSGIRFFDIDSAYQGGEGFELVKKAVREHAS